MDNTRLSSQLACGQWPVFLPLARLLSQFARKASHLYGGNLYPIRLWGVYKRRQTYNKPRAKGCACPAPSHAPAGGQKWRSAPCRQPVSAETRSNQIIRPGARRSARCPRPAGSSSPGYHNSSADGARVTWSAIDGLNLQRADSMDDQLCHSPEQAIARCFRPKVTVAVSFGQNAPADRHPLDTRMYVCVPACNADFYRVEISRRSLVRNACRTRGGLAVLRRNTDMRMHGVLRLKIDEPHPSGVEARSDSGVVLSRLLTWEKPDRWGSEQGRDHSYGDR